MALPPVVSDFLEWRWMPSVALTAGSLVFVGLVVALIPSEVDGSKPTATLSAFNRPTAPPSTAFGAALPQGPGMAEPFRRMMTSPPLPQAVQIVERAAEPSLPTPDVPQPANVTVTPDPPPPPFDPSAPHREN